MGNVLQATPMMEMLARGGYAVDLCIQGETPGVDKLFACWPHVRTASADPAVFVDREYGYYIYGEEVKGPPIDFRGRAQAVFLHPVWDWHKGFELHSEIELYTNLARAIDPELPIVTAPSCATSGRKFDGISPSTYVLAPGGQRQLQIRKWHGYAALAAALRDVAIVGVGSDLDVSNRVVFPRWLRRISGKQLDYQGGYWRAARLFAERYEFRSDFPPHAKNFIDKLSIDDTAALIEQAGAVVGNDCGLVHLAVALGKPVFAILGPSSRRKVFPPFLKNVTVIAKEYDCQPCQEHRRLGVWRESKGQVYCPYGIRCMADITPEEVAARIGRVIGQPVPVQTSVAAHAAR
jgi:hypothetical protein